MCHFRVELDAFPNFDDNQCFLEVDLLFVELNSSLANDPMSMESPGTGYKKEATSVF